MGESENTDDGHSLGGFENYPAPGRPEQPMPGQHSVSPWLVIGCIVAVLVFVTPFVLFILVSPGP